MRDLGVGMGKTQPQSASTCDLPLTNNKTLLYCTTDEPSNIQVKTSNREISSTRARATFKIGMCKMKLHIC